jgi:WD40 repeat protein
MPDAVHPRRAEAYSGLLTLPQSRGDRLIVAHGHQVCVYRMVYDDRDQDFNEVKRVFALPKHLAMVTGIAVALDGGRFVTARADGSVRVWEQKKGPALAAFDWRAGELTTVALATDGATGAAGTADGRVVLWDLS